MKQCDGHKVWRLRWLDFRCAGWFNGCIISISHEWHSFELKSFYQLLEYFLARGVRTTCLLYLLFFVRTVSLAAPRFTNPRGSVQLSARRQACGGATWYPGLVQPPTLKRRSPTSLATVHLFIQRNTLLSYCAPSMEGAGKGEESPGKCLAWLNVAV